MAKCEARSLNLQIFLPPVELCGHQTTKGVDNKTDLKRRLPMKFMMLMIPAVYYGNKKLDPNFTPDPEMVEKMTRYNDELAKAGMLGDLNGLHPLNKGARVSFAKGKTTVTDGPFVEAKEVVGGYWMIEAK